ncbi:MAG: alpha/beta hydrolase [Bacteroidia bacterium]|nr:alpha/beta hydrolase [Bacteroidia bacterium]
MFLYWILVIISIVTVLWLGVVGFSTYKFIFPPKLKDSKLPKNRPKNPKEVGLEYQEATISGYKGVPISLWWLPQPQAAPIVILSHGFAINKAMIITFIKQFYERGYQVLAMDHRAHGHSGGVVCTYGYYERHDMLACLKWVTEKAPNQPIILFGASMGSIVNSMLLSLPETQKFPIRAAVLQSPYADLPTMTRYIIRQHLGFLETIFAAPIIWFTEKNGNFQLEAVNPAKVLATVSIPKLFILGASDDEIPASFTKDTYQMAAEPKELIIFEAGHNDIHRVGGKVYWDKVFQFINQYV